MIMMKPHVINCVAPIASSTNLIDSGYIHMADNLWCTFLLSYGVSSCVTTDIVLWQSSAATTVSRTQYLPTVYRTQAAGTDAMSAVTNSTAATSTGINLELTSAQAEGNLYLIDIDPANMTDGKEFIRLTSQGDAGSEVISIAALVYPRYAQAIPVSSS